jgi:hypothetical protein
MLWRLMIDLGLEISELGFRITYSRVIDGELVDSILHSVLVLYSII